jgi:hypothetical protein
MKRIALPIPSATSGTDVTWSAFSPPSFFGGG